MLGSYLLPTLATAPRRNANDLRPIASMYPNRKNIWAHTNYYTSNITLTAHGVVVVCCTMT